MKKIISLFLSVTILMMFTLVMFVSAASALTLTVADNVHSFSTYGAASIINGDAKADGVKLVNLVHNGNPTEETVHDSGAYLLFESSAAGSVKVTMTLQCPDAVNGAVNYFIDYKMNDGAYEELDIDNYSASDDISELSDFDFTVDVVKGINKLYFNQRTANFAGGWRINVSKVVLSAEDGQTLTAQEVDKSVVISSTDKTSLGGGNYKELIGGCKTEPSDNAAAIGGKNFGYLSDGSGMSFDIKVSAPGTYKLTFTTSSPTDPATGIVDILVNDVKKATFTNDKATGGWANWAVSDNTIELELTEGKHNLKFVVPAGGSGLNILVIDVTPEDVSNPQTGDFGMFGLFLAASAVTSIVRKKRK